MAQKLQGGFCYLYFPWKGTTPGRRRFLQGNFTTPCWGVKLKKVVFAIQTNLWKMTDEIAEIFAEYKILIGSSLDGPKELNDFQREDGYFKWTMRGYEVAKEHGLSVSFITTFTPYSEKFREDIFNFYLEHGWTLKFHPALPSLRGDEPEKWAFDPEEYGRLLIYLLDKYLENVDKIEVMNIDHFCKGVFGGGGAVCTFVDCMGDVLAIGPCGGIYSCYRFVGMPEYVMGNVRDNPGIEELSKSDAWRLMFDYKDYVDEDCKDCSHIKYCRGVCPYNAITPTGGEIKDADPHCTSYKMILDEITKRVNDEMLGGSGMEMGFFQDPMKPSKPGK